MFLRQLRDIYWHASFYCEFFDLAASINQSTPAPRDLRVQDPLIMFLRHRTGLGENTVPHLRKIRDTCSRIEPQSNSLVPDGLRTPVGSVTTPQSSGEQTTFTSITYPGYSPNLVARDSASMFWRGASAGGQSEVGIEFEEWLGAYGSFQNVFPSA